MSRAKLDGESHVRDYFIAIRTQVIDVLADHNAEAATILTSHRIARGML